MNFCHKWLISAPYVIHFPLFCFVFLVRCIFSQTPAAVTAVLPGSRWAVKAFNSVVSPAALGADASKLAANLATQSLKLAAYTLLGCGSNGRSVFHLLLSAPRRLAELLATCRLLSGAIFSLATVASDGGDPPCREKRRGHGALFSDRKGDWSSAQLALFPATEHRPQSDAHRMQSLLLFIYLFICIIIIIIIFFCSDSVAFLGLTTIFIIQEMTWKAEESDCAKKGVKKLN